MKIEGIIEKDESLAVQAQLSTNYAAVNYSNFQKNIKI